MPRVAKPKPIKRPTPSGTFTAKTPPAKRKGTPADVGPSLNDLAERADAYYNARLARLALEQEVAVLKAEETLHREFLIANVSKASATGVSGKVCRVSVETKYVPAVKDWEATYAYIQETGSFDLLQRRISDTAVKLRWDEGVEIPGVKSEGVVQLKYNKI